ncbi:acylneuraminate cytidylyltransferase family protein [bacterium]|nr:acylneuraminate cytidylyltransferase family protein [bacterium]
MKIFCIIPARGGSKGVPRKNLKSFLGKPLLAHSIEYSASSKQVSRTFVTTDDSEIASVSIQSGAEVIERPAGISGDSATTESALAHAFEWWAERDLKPDIVVLLQATSPLRPVRSLDKALSHFVENRFDSLLSISPTHRFFWSLEGIQAKAEYDFLNRPRRQEIDSNDLRYIENGSLYIFTSAHFKNTGNRLGGSIGYTIFPGEYSLEIDTEMDFQLLENMAAKLG